jgi:predicted permease
LSDLFNLFLNNLGPILISAGIGFLLGKWLHINPKTFSQIIFYIFSPCLVFRLLVNSQLAQSNIFNTMLFAGLLILLVGLLSWLGGRALKLERSSLAAVLITSMFMNAGNYGLPLTQFAFGDQAAAYASLFFVVSSMFINTVGVVIASSGSTSIIQSIKRLFKLPATYSLTLALIFVHFGWKLPLALDRTVNLLGNAAVPCMLVLLGLQFTNLRWNGQVLALSLASSIRLLVSPLLALGLSRVFGLSGSAFQASILEAAMPAAVLTTVLATEFDVEPTFVTTVVLITTLLSPFTLTPLLALLGA